MGQHLAGITLLLVVRDGKLHRLAGAVDGAVRHPFGGGRLGFLLLRRAAIVGVQFEGEGQRVARHTDVHPIAAHRRWESECAQRVRFSHPILLHLVILPRNPHLSAGQRVACECVEHPQTCAAVLGGP